MRRLINIVLLLMLISFTNCTKNKNPIDVRYELADYGRQLIWKLNDGEYTYEIQFEQNSRKLEKKILDEENVRIVDSIAIIGENNNLTNDIIKHNYNSLNDDTSKNEVEFNDLVVSSELHYYYQNKDQFTMPYEIHINENYLVKANIEVSQNNAYSQTEYAGGYEFKLEPRDVMLYRMIQSKLSKESIKTDTVSKLVYGHQIVIDNYTIINNPKRIYNTKELSSIIMFTDYIVLKYIRELKPSKNIQTIHTLRKRIEPEIVI